MAYEDGEEEEAVPLEELFHELQARFAEISRDSPRSGAEMRFPSHEAPAGGGSSLQARLSGASSPTASRSPSSRRGHRLPRPRPRLLHHQRRARPSACRPSSGRSRASGWSATRRRSTSRGAICGARLARDHPRSPEITRDHPEITPRRRFDDLGYLLQMNAAERAAVAEGVGMKPGHAGKFVKHGFEAPVA